MTTYVVIGGSMFVPTAIAAVTWVLLADDWPDTSDRNLMCVVAVLVPFVAAVIWPLAIVTAIIVAVAWLLARHIRNRREAAERARFEKEVLGL